MLAMTNKLVVIINSLKVPKIKKILLYEMEFLVPNYSCLQIRGLPLPDPRSLCPLSSTEFVDPPPEKNSWVRHCAPWIYLWKWCLLTEVPAAAYYWRYWGKQPEFFLRISCPSGCGTRSQDLQTNSQLRCCGAIDDDGPFSDTHFRVKRNSVH
jgi:hypothetical protein